MHLIHSNKQLVTDHQDLTPKKLRVFNSHIWEKGDTRQAFARKSDYPYQLCAVWTMGDPSRTESSDSANRVTIQGGGKLFCSLQYRHFAASIFLLFLIGYITCASADIRFHKVRRGETLAQIAKSHGVSYRYLACLNDITNPNRIWIGQRIALPRSRHNERNNIDLKWPINQGRITSRFGPRGGVCHDGIDIGAPLGTSVQAADKGKVAFSGVRGSYGKVVIIQHSKGYRTLYAHLKRIYVKKNQRVKRGQRIAKVGSTGRSTGPHLHFEVRKNGKALDPMSFLSRKTRIVLNPKASFGGGRGQGGE